MGPDSSNDKLTLKGSTWGHERGYAPLINLNKDHADLFPANVDWDIRTLQQFADQSMSELASKYDLIVFDHPWTGEISVKEYFYPLNDFISPEYLKEQSKNSVGKSYQSYIWKGNLYGLQIDAAGHVSAARTDLLKANNLVKPKSWQEVLQLAKDQKAKGGPLVALSLDPVNIWCLFMTMAANQKLNPYSDGVQVVPRQAGIEILNLMIEIGKFGPTQAYEWNPIHLLDALSSTNDLFYCPSLFGYSNYSVSGFRAHRVEFGEIPSSGFGAIGGILGGAGIGITKSCKNPEIAAKLVEILGSPAIQSSLYATSGGQSGHRSAWLDSKLNDYTNNFYKNTLENLDNSYLRPTFPGFIEIQSGSGDILAEAVYGKTSVETALDAVDKLYRDTVKEWSIYS